MTINSKSFDTFEELSKDLNLISFLSSYTKINSLKNDSYIYFNNLEFQGTRDIFHEDGSKVFGLAENHTYILLFRFEGITESNIIYTFTVYADDIPISLISDLSTETGQLNCNEYIFYTSSIPSKIQITNNTQSLIENFNCKFLILEVE